jgi:hypothetical protein
MSMNFNPPPVQESARESRQDESVSPIDDVLQEEEDFLEPAQPLFTKVEGAIASSNIPSF